MPCGLVSAWPLCQKTTETFAVPGRTQRVIRRDAALLGAGTIFALASGFGSAVAIRHDIAGEPFGLGVGLTVRRGICIGWGAGIAAPWPMPAAALIAAAKANESRCDTAPGWVAAGLGIGCLVGTFIEPVTYRPRSWTPAILVAILSNVVASAALTAAGLRHARRDRCPSDLAAQTPPRGTARRRSGHH